MKNIIYITIAVLSLYSCKKIVLDNLAFPSEKLNEYALENYEGEIIIPSTYDIPEDKIHLFPLTSTDVHTGETFEIYALYIGDLTTIATDTVILYAHGQSKHMDNYWGRAKLLANLAHIPRP